MAKVDKTISILLADDDAMVRQVLADYLRIMGFTMIEEVSDGTDAIKKLKDPKYRCDLVISDWEMPEASGLTVLKAVRNNPNRAHTRFMMVTSQRSMERFKITQAAQWHVDAYLVKPFREKAFREKIWQVMEWEGAEDEVAS